MNFCYRFILFVFYDSVRFLTDQKASLNNGRSFGRARLLSALKRYSSTLNGFTVRPSNDFLVSRIFIETDSVQFECWIPVSLVLGHDSCLSSARSAFQEIDPRQTWRVPIDVRTRLYEMRVSYTRVRIYTDLYACRHIDTSVYAPYIATGERASERAIYYVFAAGSAYNISCRGN